MNIKTKIGLLILFILIIIFIYSIPISNSAIYYKGTYEDFHYHGLNSFVTLKAEGIRFDSGIFIFRNIKNVTIKKNGDNLFYNTSTVHAELNENKYGQVIFSDAYLEIFFTDTIIERTNPYLIKFYGTNAYLRNSNPYLGNTIKLINGNVKITDDDVSFLQINDENVSDYSYVTFEIDDTSDVYVYLNKDSILIDAFDVSEINVNGQLLEIDLRGKGIMWLEDRPYNIESNDIKIKSNLNFIPLSEFIIENGGMEFNTIAKSVKLNSKNIMKGLIPYWFNQRPEKLNTIAALILAVITGAYVFFTKGILEQTKATVKQGEESLKQTEANIKQTEKIVEQTKIQQKIACKEKRLVNYYYPLHNFLNLYVNVRTIVHKDEKITEIYVDSSLYDKKTRNDLPEYIDIIKNQYLAKKETRELFNDFIDINVTKGHTVDETDIIRYNNLIVKINEDIEKLNEELLELID